MYWGPELNLGLASLWCNGTLDVVDTDIVLGPKDHLAGIVACVSSQEADRKINGSLVHDHT